MKNIIKKIIAETPRRHKIRGQITTTVVSVLGIITASGLLDNQPEIKTIVQIITGVLINKTYNHAIQVER